MRTFKLTSCLHSHLPVHASREIVILFGSLTTVDPGNIHDTLEACVKDKIRISVVALAAEMKICRELAVETGGDHLHAELLHRKLKENKTLTPFLLRGIRRCLERRSLQRPPLGTHPSPRPTGPRQIRNSLFNNRWSHPR
jgi:hypothetical protein